MSIATPLDYTATVTSSAVFVADLGRSVDFYERILHCTVGVREPRAAILLTAGGFQLYLIERDVHTSHPLGGIGNQGLMWATNSAEELGLVAAALRNAGAYVDTHTEGGITFVEGHDPDDLRVLVAYPGPARQPRSMVASRLYT